MGKKKDKTKSIVMKEILWNKEDEENEYVNFQL